MGGKSDLRSNADNGLGEAGWYVATIFGMPYSYFFVHMPCHDLSICMPGYYFLSLGWRYVRCGLGRAAGKGNCACQCSMKQ